MVQLKEQQIPSFLVNAKGAESSRKKWYSFLSSEKIDLVMQWNYSLVSFLSPKSIAYWILPLIYQKKFHVLEAGKELVTLVESTLSMNIPPFQVRGTSFCFYFINVWKDVSSLSFKLDCYIFSGGEIKRRYKSFLGGKYQQLPEDFSFWSP